MGSAYDLRTAIDEMRNRWPTVGLALGIVPDGQLEAFHAEGFADVASRTPVTLDTVFRIGSLTRTFTAMAVVQGWGGGPLTRAQSSPRARTAGTRECPHLVPSPVTGGGNQRSTRDRWTAPRSLC